MIVNTSRLGLRDDTELTASVKSAFLATVQHSLAFLTSDKDVTEIEIVVTVTRGERS